MRTMYVESRNTAFGTAQCYSLWIGTSGYLMKFACYEISLYSVIILQCRFICTIPISNRPRVLCSRKKLDASI